MRILYLCHRVPYPPNKGEKIRAFHQLRSLGEQHEVDLFTLADQPEDMAHRPALLKHCARVTVAAIHPRAARLRSLPYLLTKKPLTLAYFHSKELALQVQRALAARSYDRIFVYCSAMAQYAVEGAGSIPMLTDLVDVDSDKWLQYAASSRFPASAVYRREGLLLREYERAIGERSSCVLVTTEREAALARETVGIQRLAVVPNGVDAEYFSPAAVPPDPAARSIVFTGDMSYFPNQEAAAYFAREVFPFVRKFRGDARFLIVGRNPTRKVRKLAQIDGVEVTGFVPDVRRYLSQARVSVAPFLIAAGIQNKILEAMAYGLPVVATRRATQGLSPGVAEAVETAETSEELAARVLDLLENRKLADQKGSEGRAKVVELHNWNTVLSRLRELVLDPSGSTRTEARSNSGSKRVVGARIAP